MPLKHRELRGFGFDPLGRLSFDLGNQLGYGDRFGKPAKDMNVILNTTNDERRRIEVVARSGQVGVEFPAEAIVLKEWLAENSTPTWPDQIGRAHV